MKVAINQDIGGFCLPDTAILRLVELGMTHFVQETEDLSGMPKDSIFVWESYDNPRRKRELTLFCQSREEAAKDARVIKVVEEIILSGCKEIQHITNFMFEAAQEGMQTFKEVSHAINKLTG